VAFLAALLSCHSADFLTALCLLVQEGVAAAQREARQLQAENEELRQAALASRNSLEVGAAAAMPACSSSAGR
jgi:plasmid stabilization system protein ParE